MKQILFLILFSFTCLYGQQPGERKYAVYNSNNQPISLKVIAEEMKNYDVIFFGEEHNDSVGHQVQIELLKELHKLYGNKVALSLEMFDRDVQTIMDEYLMGSIREKHFLKDARVWTNYTDYKPMIEYSKINKLNVICANAASRYTNVAGRLGQDALKALPASSQKNFAPLPYDTASGEYYNKIYNLSGHGSPKDSIGKQVPPAMMMHGFSLNTAQSLWDATMAYSIDEYLKNNKGNKVMMINGRFHSDEGFGAFMHLAKRNPKLRIANISCFRTDEPLKADASKYKHLGTYIIMTDARVAPTFKD